MARRAFDRYMVAIGMGTHPKFARLTDGEFRAHVVGVLAIAAMAPVRGHLLVGELPAEPVDVAAVAGVPLRVAESAMVKLEAVGVLRRDQERGCLRVHDWEDCNPPPGSSTDRVRRYRAAQGNECETVNGGGSVSKALHDALPEVKEEVEVELPASTTSQQVARRRATRRVDQSKLPDGFPDELRPVAEQVLTILTGVYELRGGVAPGLRGVGLGIMRNVRADHLSTAQKLQHWLLAGNGQRARCADVSARFGDWVEGEGTAVRAGNGDVVALHRADALERADAWQHGYEREGA